MIITVRVVIETSKVRGIELIIVSFRHGGVRVGVEEVTARVRVESR
jgi:hypothetical protein